MPPPPKKISERAPELFPHIDLEYYVFLDLAKNSDVDERGHRLRFSTRDGEVLAARGTRLAISSLEPLGLFCLRTLSPVATLAPAAGLRLLTGCWKMKGTAN